MKNNRKGFTLIEMLVCIGIIAALSVAIGLSANTIVKNANKKNYKDLMQDVLNNAAIYYELSDSNCGISCNIPISALVEKGLISKDIYAKANPLFAEDTILFRSEDILTVYKSNGLKDVSFTCKDNGSSVTIKLSEIDTFDEWGKCNER